ncbi:MULTISPECIES: dihydropteroate synthase [Bacillus]|uniref:Dihydropteroate synthase n=2 Tax=Bacillus toyonensis TaxID=155322 RepID=A0ABX6G2W4_9BACI|nr:MULTISPECIES: dihydropteroate synthase [Bacillus]EOP31968.1 dihydropteroate synthase [Bacillus cereus VD131]OUB07134.1 dihydropteroate synthase [Bacillus thuringiensis serovar shandongiensis]AXK16234.1 dihydropteroate synthase [Bacillus sp. COPE52]EJR69562.1 dihydropteroate synthase [Bacillus toyonensis]KAF6552155.1 dihydropteroate synthase [Bacillus sp. EKM202B]
MNCEEEMCNLKWDYDLRCGEYTLNLNEKTLIMGILNVTPDSFSDGGSYNEVDAAVRHAKEMKNEGAHIIDIGGESTRPGFAKVSVEEEIKRVVPMIQTVSKEVELPISIDTYKAEVAKQAIEAGAHIINDIWGAKAEPEIAEVAAHYDVPIILMHNRDNMSYRNLMADMIADLYDSIKIAKAAGVRDENIILDPGIGFAKTPEQNLEAMRNLEQLNVLGYPVLLGTSRKSFIGHVLDLPVEERLEGTGATVCLGIEKGCEFVRVHDVKEMARMAKMMDAMIGKGVK